MRKIIYMDHAATTPVSELVIEEMLPYYQDYYGNPSSLYEFADISKQAVNGARQQIARLLGVLPNEIYFTSGGTEADNWALRGALRQKKGNHLIISDIEHPAIKNTAAQLEQEGYRVTRIGVDKKGVIRLEELKNAICEDTVLISIMFANNEIGTIEPIKKIAAIAHEHDILFHTDGVQVFGQIPSEQSEFGFDMFSASAHKLGGPKGIGFLYIKNKCINHPLLEGGGQEQNLRAGTENVPGIVGFGMASEIAKDTMKMKMKKEQELRDYFIYRLLHEGKKVTLNGSMVDRLPGNVNVSFLGISSSTILMILDEHGICASGGSACTSRKREKSHVLKAIGATNEQMNGAIRFTLGEENTKQEIDFVMDVIKQYV